MTSGVEYVDSHTEGEPTRAIVSGYPDLAGESAAAKARDFAARWDEFRRAVILEPRGFEAVVGALVLPPSSDGSLADLIFFNNRGVLGMCGHGTLGVAETLRYRLGLAPGVIRFGTPVGEVSVELLEVGAAVENVPAFVFRRGVSVSADGLAVSGDVAYGGNWFFLTSDAPVPVRAENIGRLTEFSTAVMRELGRVGITGADGAEIDHVEIFGPPTRPDCQSKNFVLCPGGAYDRSPCGTGTSAKLAVLAADGLLAPGEVWRQESIIGSSFSASFRLSADGKVTPRIEGRAFVTAEGRLRFDADDPFREGIVLSER